MTGTLLYTDDEFEDIVHPQRYISRLLAHIADLERHHVYEYEKLAIALRELPLNDTTLQAIAIICRSLKEQNPRFEPGVFMEWCLEDV